MRSILLDTPYFISKELKLKFYDADHYIDSKGKIRSKKSLQKMTLTIQPIYKIHKILTESFFWQNSQD